MSKSIKLDPHLWQRVAEHAQKVGYSSPDEFVMHLLEKELSRLDDAEIEAHKEVERRLKGLGYLE
jgi:macrodomain Ter protein organizer (MatP/YcbG family)